MQLYDPHFCMLELLSEHEERAVQKEPARVLVRQLAQAKMVSWDGEKARILRDGASALADYREVCAYVEAKGF